MSLTSHLSDPASPVKQYLMSRLGNTKPIAKSANPDLRAAHTLLPPREAPGYLYGMIGHAIDYRLRYYFHITPYRELVAWQGVEAGNFFAPDDASVWYDQQAAIAFMEQLDAHVARLNPVGRQLDAPANQELARSCFVLALFEALFRAGRMDGPLFQPPMKSSPLQLLAMVDDGYIEDICQLADLFYLRCQHLLSQPFVLNPDFVGSRDVGGADADLIVNGCLIDIKTTKTPGLDAKWLYQVLGYVLLDYDDALGINAVAIYMARQGVLLEWPLGTLLHTLTGDATVTIDALRAEFRQVCQRGTTIAGARRGAETH